MAVMCGRGRQCLTKGKTKYWHYVIVHLQIMTFLYVPFFPTASTEAEAICSSVCPRASVSVYLHVRSLFLHCVEWLQHTKPRVSSLCRFHVACCDIYSFLLWAMRPQCTDDCHIETLAVWSFIKTNDCFVATSVRLACVIFLHTTSRWRGWTVSGRSVLCRSDQQI